MWLIIIVQILIIPSLIISEPPLLEIGNSREGKPILKAELVKL